MRNTAVYIAMAIGVFVVQVTAFAQKDTLPLLQELQFVSSAEQEAWVRVDESDCNTILGLLMTSSSKDITQSDVDAAVGQLDLQASLLKKYVTKKSNVKMLKRIYKEIHDQYFVKYHLENDFAAVFRTGEYNCVSASAIYALLFEKLGIPYEIRETAVHVYMVAFPGEHQVTVETTAPDNGITEYSSSFKQKYIDWLLESKVITRESLDHVSTSELFETYFTSSSSISLRGIVGVQYWNLGVFYAKSRKWLKAFDNFEKSYAISPTSKSQLQMIISGTEFLRLDNFASHKSLEVLAKLERQIGAEMDREYIAHSVSSFIYSTLIEHSDTAMLHRGISYLMSRFTDEEVRKSTSYEYNFEVGRMLYNKVEYGKALPYLDEAYRLKPDHARAEDFYLDALQRSVGNEKNFVKMRSMVGAALADHPGLAKNMKFVSIQANLELILFGISYETNDPKQGSFHREIFEQLYRPNLIVEDEVIEKAYSNAAVYYFKRGDFPRSKWHLNKGLELVPESYGLKQRLGSF